jgi:hypothetical protein
MAKARSATILRPIVLALIAIFIAQRFNLDILKQIYPWILLWTPDREGTLAAWKKYAPINHAIVYPPRPIPEINSEGLVFIFTLRFTAVRL